MDPTSKELKDIKSIDDILDWVGVEDRAGPPASNFRSAFLEILGGPTRLRHIVAIPKPTYDAIAKEIRVSIAPQSRLNITFTAPDGAQEQAKAAAEQRSITPIEEGMLMSVRRVARLALDLPADELTLAGTGRQGGDRASIARSVAESRGMSMLAPGNPGQDTPHSKSSRTVRIAEEGESTGSRGPTSTFMTAGRGASQYTGLMSAYTGKEVLMDQDQEEKEDWLFVVNQLGPAAAGDWLKAAPERACRDFDVVMMVVRKRGQALQYAAEEMRADEQVVLTAVDQKESAMEFAAWDLRSDREFVLRVLEISGGVLEYASPELQADREVVFKAIENNAAAIFYAPEDYRSNRQFILQAAAVNGGILRFVNKPEFRWDKAIVTAAVSQDGSALAYASPKLRADRQLVLKAVANKGKALEHADGSLKADREVVRVAIQQDGNAIQFAAEELRTDTEFVGLVVQQSSQRHTANRAARPSLMQRLRRTFTALMGGDQETEDGTAKRCFCC